MDPITLGLNFTLWSFCGATPPPFFTWLSQNFHRIIVITCSSPYCQGFTIDHFWMHYCCLLKFTLWSFCEQLLPQFSQFSTQILQKGCCHVWHFILSGFYSLTILLEVIALCLILHLEISLHNSFLISNAIFTRLSQSDCRHLQQSSGGGCSCLWLTQQNIHDALPTKICWSYVI